MEIEPHSQNIELILQETGWQETLQELEHQIDISLQKLRELLQNNPDPVVQNKLIFRAIILHSKTANMLKGKLIKPDKDGKYTIWIMQKNLEHITIKLNLP